MKLHYFYVDLHVAHPIQILIELLWKEVVDNDVNARMKMWTPVSQVNQ